MNENKLQFDRFHEELANSMADEESSTYHRKLMDLVRELSKVKTPDELRERFSQFVKVNGLRKKVDDGLYSFSVEAVERYFEYQDSPEEEDDLTKSLESQSRWKYHSDIKVKRGGVMEARTKKKFVVRLLDCISHFEKNEYEENGNIVSFIPNSYHKYVVGSRSAGCILDFDCIETLMIREGLIAPYSNYMPPLRGSDGTILRKGMCKRFVINKQKLESLKTGVSKYIITDSDFQSRQLKKVCNLNDNEIIIALGIFNFTPLKKDYDLAIRDIELYKSGRKDEMTMDFGSASIIKATYEKDYEKIISWSIDNYSGRFHSVVTRLSSEYRKRMVTLEGERTVEIDLRSSQPSILFSTIERELGYKSPIAESCMKGQFYEELAVRSGLAKSIEDVSSNENLRDRAKLLFMQGCYSSSLRNIYDVGLFNKAIKSWDEKAYQYIQSRRKSLVVGGVRKSSLPKIMQEEEVKLVLGSVVSSCIENGILEITTIHDCIKCRESDAESVREIMKEEFFKRYDRIPYVNIEY